MINTPRKGVMILLGKQILSKLKEKNVKRAFKLSHKTMSLKTTCEKKALLNPANFTKEQFLQAKDLTMASVLVV